MNKVIVETIDLASKNPKMKDDRVFRQTFTCCGKQLEKFLWEGWDWVDGNIIDSEITKEFKYCPYCGKKLNSEEEKV